MKDNLSAVCVTRLLITLALFPLFSTNATNAWRVEDKERLAAFLFQFQGVNEEQAAALITRFHQLLKEGGKFEVVPHNEMVRLLTEAEFRNPERCDYSYCLADAGKVLGVRKVLHGSLTKRGKLYTLRLRLIDVTNTEVILDRKTDFSGEFNEFLSHTLPVEARSVSDYSLQSDTKWYTIAAAIVVTVGTIYWIYKVFDKSISGDSIRDGTSIEQ